MSFNKIIITLTLVLIKQDALAYQSKTSNSLQDEMKNNPVVEIFVLLNNQNSLQKNNSLDRIQRLKNTIQQLKSNAKISREIIEPQLSSITKDYKFFWANNSFWAKMPSDKVTAFAASKAIQKAFSNKAQKLSIVKSKKNNSSVKSIDWNLSMINAQQVWNQGFKGQNVIIAGQDTGYQWDHISLKNKYAGWNGSTVDHNYYWHDAITNPNVNCLDAQNNPASCDDHGHGTHTMGTMVGDDGVGNQIGVAPDAKWIGCRNMNQGNGTPTTYTECFQFFLEPTDLNGANPDVTKAPHIINNSWGCPSSEGCTQPDALESIVNNVVNAGILVVAAAGNDGSGCGSINTPIAIYNKTLTIGSTTSSDTISSFSSRGAVTIDGSNRIKPDLSAPGSSIRSAQLNGGYSLKSGTSMASPHVAGVAALLISANPSLAGNPERLTQIILESSVIKASNQTCNGVAGSQSPNNTFGWGRLDALAAVNLARELFIFDNSFENN
jgi:subtilisin family serine protease